MRKGLGRRRWRAASFNDAFRGNVSIVLAAMFAAVVWLVCAAFGVLIDSVAMSFFLLCTLVAAFMTIYTVWTYRLFNSTAPPVMMRVARQQERAGVSTVSRLIGVGRADDWAIASAQVSLVIAIAATTLGARSEALLTVPIVVVTVAASWASIVVTFALRYLRLHAAGETIEFDIVTEPRFTDFVSMSVMISSVGAMSAATPRTSAGLSAVRLHTIISFAYNALVIAVVISLMTTLIAAP